MELTSKSTARIDNSDISLVNLDRKIWQQLKTAPADKHSKFKNFTVATIDSNGLPDARIVVLRQVDDESRMLWFHTDVRSGKIAQLQAKPEVLLLFWDEEQQVQLRCRASTTIHTDDTEASNQWAKTWEGNRKMYLSEYEPGSIRPEPHPGFPIALGENLPTREASEAGRPNFAVVECRVTTVDYLHLSRAGQTRARFEYAGEQAKREWLTP